MPFEVAHASRVGRAADLERALHVAFAPHRINPRREFFQIEPEQVAAILRAVEVEDATSEVEATPSGLDAESREAGTQLRSRRPNLNFQEMGIPVGAELVSTFSDARVTVQGPRKVMFSGEETSLTATTRELLGLSYSVAPGPYWTWNGKLLSDLYEATYTRLG